MATEEKLYPPIIDGTLPAFYKENGTAKITVPFSISRGVVINKICGFAIKIKTIQSNTLIYEDQIIESNNDIIIEEYIKPKQVKFSLDNNSLSKINIGQFLKVQIAFVSKINNISQTGYYSTIGIIKYTAKPTIEIKNLSFSEDNSFQDIYTGIYNSEDITEYPCFYKFSLYKSLKDESDNKSLIETSDWLLHNSSQEGDFYSFHNDIEYDETIDYYSVQYSVKTLNGLQIDSSFYKINNKEERDSYLNEVFELLAENNYEDGYISLFLKLKEPQNNKIYITKESVVSPGGGTVEEKIAEKFKAEDEEISGWYYKSGDILGHYQITKSGDTQKTIYYDYKQTTGSPNRQFYLYKYEVVVNINNNNNNNEIYYVFPNPLEINLYRKNNISGECIKINSYNFTEDDNDKNFNWNFKDFNIEQGVNYTYYIKENINENCLKYFNNTKTITYSKLSKKIKSKQVYADFEDVFLSDGKQQIKIHFNPKISSFKINHLEQKTDTIGSQYPFIFRNGVVEYKEFPISGLISYHLDDNELFINKEDLQLINSKKLERQCNPYNYNPNNNFDNKNFSSTDLLYYNIYAERQFKLKLLEWLGNGKTKLFKSPTEGNYLIKLMNISLSPEDKLGRMLHNFSCTAYEVEECNYKNLKEIGFFTNEKGD